jgi:inhibitor of KinA sporulation pathway (predicted exonuclease)
VSDDGEERTSVEDEDFNEFVRYLKPEFKVPDRKKLTKELLAKLQEQVEKEMMKRKEDIPKFSCTFDSRRPSSTWCPPASST